MSARTPQSVPRVTDRQMEVARLVSLGYTNERIADHLGISLAGAKYHVAELLGRLGLQRRSEIAEWYREREQDATGWRAALRALFGPVGWLATGATLAGFVAVVVVTLAVLDARSGAIEPPVQPVATPAEESAGLRSSIAEIPALQAVVDSVLAGPDEVVAMMVRVPAYCSSRGEVLFDFCEERGLGPWDTVEGVVVSDLLHCEGCQRPPEEVLMALKHLYVEGEARSLIIRDETEEPSRAGPGAGMQLVAAWELDDATGAVIAERWPDLGAARYVLAFEAVEASSADDVPTGFVLYVDPAAVRPILILEPTGTTYSAAQTARELGRGAWRGLDLR